MAKQKYEKGKLSLRGTRATRSEVDTEKAVKELNTEKPAAVESETQETAKPESTKKATPAARKPTVKKSSAKPKTQRFTVDFPEDRYFKFKMEALKRRRTVKDMLLEAMDKTFGL